MHALLVLATEAAGEKTLWDPTILGILVVMSAIGLFCGSVYLLLSTNMGARLGFLVAAACLTGFMVLLSGLWITTATPLNSPRGRQAGWHVVDVVTDLSESDIEAVRNIATEGDQVDQEGVANLRPAVEAGLVTVEGGEGEAVEQPFARYDAAAKFLTDFEGHETYEVGGGTKEFSITRPWSIFQHTTRYAAVQFCDTRQVPEVPGQAPPAPTCDPLAPKQFAIMEYDFGSLRQVPWVYFSVSLVLFGLSLLGLHWYEKDARAAKSAAVAKNA